MHRPAIGLVYRCQLPPESLAGTAREAEALGFDEFWVIEDCFYAGAIASATAALAATTTIPVAIGILPAVARNAAFTAMDLAAMARLFPGRLVAGFGHGLAEWMAQVGATPPSPLAVLEETMISVRALLGGETVTMTGRHVRLDSVRLNHPPAQPVPVLAGVRGPKSLRAAGRSADGTILAEPTSPAYVRWVREQIDAGRTEAGRDDHHRLVAFAWLSVGDDREAAREALRPAVAATLITTMADAHLAPLGILDELRELRGRCADVDELALLLPAAWLDQLTVNGTPADCAATIRDLAAAGADSIVLLPRDDVADAQTRLAARSILPLLSDG